MEHGTHNTEHIFQFCSMFHVPCYVFYVMCFMFQTLKNFQNSSTIKKVNRGCS